MDMDVGVSAKVLAEELKRARERIWLLQTMLYEVSWIASNNKQGWHDIIAMVPPYLSKTDVLTQHIDRANQVRLQELENKDDSTKL